MTGTKNLFVTGKPASGKTTLIRESCLPYLSRIGGFYTEELTDGPKRLGFVLKTFDGKEGVLARKGMKSPCVFNKYGVDVRVLDEIGARALADAARNSDIIVVDEIGSMELLSGAFRQALLACLASPKRVLATIRFNAQPFTDEVKRMADTSLVYLSRDNFPAVKREVQEWLKNDEREHTT